MLLGWHPAPLEKRVTRPIDLVNVLVPIERLTRPLLWHFALAPRVTFARHNALLPVEDV